MFLTSYLGLYFTLHLQRVNKDAAVADEAGAGDASVRLAEPLLIKIFPEKYKQSNIKYVRFTFATMTQTGIFVDLEK